MAEISSPLRVSKKLQTRSDLLANAIALFRRQGIRATRAAEIAAAAGVSPATLFNYFATKNELAEAWLRGELGEQLEVLAAEKGDRSLRAALRGFCRDLAEVNFRERAVRAEAWSEIGRAPTDGPARIRPLLPWIEREQSAGRLRADLSSITLADMVVEALESGLVDGLASSVAKGPNATGASKASDPAAAAAAAGIDALGAASATERDLADRLRARVDLVLDGARKRNERVAASAVGAQPRESPEDR